MDDKAIVELLYAKNEAGLNAAREKYGACLTAVADGILQRHEDVEECVNDTWLEAWRVIPPHRPETLRMFLAKITRALAFNRFKRLRAQKRGGGEIELCLDELAECAGGCSAEDELMRAELSETLRRFVNELPRREANVFVRRYFFAEPVAETARSYGMTVNATSVMLSRTRAKLRKRLIQEGYLNEQ